MNQSTFLSEQGAYVLINGLCMYYDGSFAHFLR